MSEILNIGAELYGYIQRGVESMQINDDGCLIVILTDGTTENLGVVKGDTGSAGIGITSIAKTGTSGLADTYTISYSNGTASNFTVTNGAKGDRGDKGDKGDRGDTGNTGVGIVSITKASTSGLTDTYRILLSNGSSYGFNVTNGESGESYTAGEGISISGGVISVSYADGDSALYG
ncbi:MAG: hypothetical protein IJQ80_04335 [Clostridia bacterium]|nr:hypothetical protein [Clostridia bacterium]